MAQTPASSDPPPEDMHWGISYLREDLQDQRQELRELRREMQEGFREGNARLDSRFNVLLSAMIALNTMVVGAIIYFIQIYLPA